MRYASIHLCTCKTFKNKSWIQNASKIFILKACHPQTKILMHHISLKKEGKKTHTHICVVAISCEGVLKMFWFNTLPKTWPNDKTFDFLMFWGSNQDLFSTPSYYSLDRNKIRRFYFLCKYLHTMDFTSTLTTICMRIKTYLLTHKL